jgi:DMSO/TMAO reductase YedYZ molybdopterin-dependent catalytic subunit
MPGHRRHHDGEPPHAHQDSQTSAERWSDLPPGQHAVATLPEVSRGPVPTIELEQWTVTVTTERGQLAAWDWAELNALPQVPFETDVHCVQGWSLIGSSWEGVPVRLLLSGLDTSASYAVATGADRYRVCLPVDDLLEMPTWVVLRHAGHPLSPAHGAPARLLVPHLYLHQSVKWLTDLALTDRDVPGTPAALGLHPYGDPWRQQRYRDQPRTPIPTLDQSTTPPER